MTTDLMKCSIATDGTMIQNYGTDGYKESQNCWDWWHYHYYPTYYPSVFYEDKGKKAIQIVKILMEDKTIQVKTVKQFVELLDKIMEVL